MKQNIFCRGGGEMKRWKRSSKSNMNREQRRTKESGINYVRELMKVIQHFFPKFMKWLSEMKDPRHKSYIYYNVNVILLTRLLGSIMGISSMRGLTENFNKQECIKNIQAMLGDNSFEDLPQYDTINDLLEDFDPEELKKLQHKLITRLIQMKCFDKYRFKKQWLISIDGTGLFTFNKRHCEHCLTKTHNKGKPNEYTQYFHYVLEAKITILDMVFTIASEFVENEEDLDKLKDTEFDNKKKQDCELKAFYRMANSLKKKYPRLPICLLLDSLYANQNVFAICEANNWSYMIRFKEGSLPSVAKEFETISNYDLTNTSTYKTNEYETIIYRFVNDINYQNHRINIVEYKQTIENTETKTIETQTFTFITSPNLKITKKNQAEIVMTGRQRWRIENHGFNEQKNHGYELTHTFSHNYTAMKNHYMLIQIAHMIRQLFEVGIKILKEHRKTLEFIGELIKESFRTSIIYTTDIEYINRRSQIKILPS